MEVSESVSETAGIDDLISDQLGAEPSPPSADAAPSEPVSQEATPAPSPVEDISAQEPVPAQAVAETPNALAPSQPTPPQTYKIGDRDYTAQEIQAALTSAQQLPNLQRKYVDVLEQMRQSQQAPQGQQPTQPAQPQMSQADWVRAVRHKYDPLVQEGVKNGTIEADFAALFPGMAAQMLAYRDGFVQQSQVLQSVVADRQAQYQQAQSSGLVNDMSRNLQMLAQSGEAFASLKDPNQVQGFIKYLYDLNPMTSQVRNPDFLARQWVAYNKDQYLQQAQAKQVAQQRMEQTRLARADATTAARPAGLNQPVQQTPLDQMIADHWDRSL